MDALKQNTAKQYINQYIHHHAKQQHCKHYDLECQAVFIIQGILKIKIQNHLIKAFQQISNLKRNNYGKPIKANYQKQIQIANNTRMSTSYNSEQSINIQQSLIYNTKKYNQSNKQIYIDYIKQYKRKLILQKLTIIESNMQKILQERQNKS